MLTHVIALAFGFAAGGLIVLATCLAAQAAADAEEAAERDRDGWKTPVAVRVDDLEAVLRAGSPITRRESLWLIDVIRKAWRRNARQLETAVRYDLPLVENVDTNERVPA